MSGEANEQEKPDDSEQPVGRADHESPRPNREMDAALLSLLVCPLSRGPLRYDKDKHELVSEKAGLAYPVKDGIPVMLVDEARQLDSSEMARIKAQFKSSE